jgi:DNA invertase Pin-like site-specific DNA recombinase
MKTAIYLRQSLDRDHNKLANDRQRRSAQAGRREGWEKPVKYCDNNMLASKGRRPADEDLCADICNGAVSQLAEKVNLSKLPDRASLSDCSLHRENRISLGDHH